MLTLDIKDIFSLLIENVLKTPGEFINFCEQSGMSKRDPIADVGQYSQLPPYDSRHCYQFKSPSAKTVIFEILITSGVVIQAGVNLYYRNNFIFKVAEKKFKQAKILLDNYFGLGVPIKAENTIGYNYGDHKLLGYISLMNNYNVNIKVGNAELFNTYFPINKE